MLKRFIGAVSEMDAYCWLKWMCLPTQEKNLDTVIAEVEILCNLMGLKPVAEYKAMQIVSMLLKSLMLQAFGHPGGICKVSVDELKTLLCTHYQAKGLKDNGMELMDVNMVHENAEETDGDGTSNVAALCCDNHYLAKASNSQQSAKGSTRHRLSKYDLFKVWVSRETYDYCANNKLCLGCGQEHSWAKCALKKRPKGQQD
ncbi:hypothetical protein GGF41_003243 [Coemansia sp. RSA 2531]|nr:hypothetical protein GGF41_003243 [Coemansia sp. RSA 2531]